MIGDNNVIREGVTIHRGTIQDRAETTIGDGNLLMAYVHVGHDSVINNHCILVNNAALAGHVLVEDYAILGGFTLVHQFCRIGAHCFTGMGSAIGKDVPAFMMVTGAPAEPRNINVEGLKRRGFSKQDLSDLSKAFKILYRRGLTVEEAIAELNLLSSPSVQVLIDSLRSSTRGHRQVSWLGIVATINTPSKPLRVAIVAGEASGDILGAGLISAMKKRQPNSEFFGVGGEKMLAEGFQSWFAMDRLAVMGLIEPLKRIFELLSMRRQIKKRLLASPPDVFIGIDSPDFNLSLEESLRKQGIKVVHYVSPSVWAWRQGRIKKIARAVDLMLALFPFEEAFYHAHKVKVCCVGHPLADAIPLQPNMQEARTKVRALDGVSSDFKGQKVLGILPGSRASEVRLHARLFLEAAQICWQQDNSLVFIIPAANAKRHQEIQEVLKDFPGLPVSLILKHSHEAMAASDALLIASGTTALEAMLLKRPTLISYKMSNFAFSILKRMVKVKFVGLPNLLAERALVPELLQTDATPEKLAEALIKLLRSSNEEMIEAFFHWHKHLRRDANQTAAQAVFELIEQTAECSS